MRESIGDIFEKKPSSAIVITTNGFIKAKGNAVLGRGCAKQAVDKYPDLGFLLGQKLKYLGNHVHKFDMPDGKILVTFPVKAESETCELLKTNVVVHQRNRMKAGAMVPGWACVARMGIIERSCKELVKMTNEEGWEDVIMPRPGCGAGELRWDHVRRLLDEYLDDRFVVMNFK